ncbi:MAG TPA: hypothetical protein VM686_24285 [Polyangiaceae bacterium]|nr:hypothetical protein [Polyangiaceae bacterium]
MTHARAWYALLTAALLSLPDAARAQLTQAVHPQNAPLDSTPAESSTASYWAGARARTFVSATLELGLSYVRIQLASGYGRPHHDWYGLEGYTGVSSGSLAQYLGLRRVLPWASLRGGVRYQAAFERSLLPIQDHYTRRDLDTPLGDPWQYFVLEGEASATARLPFGQLTALLSGHYFTLVPERDAYIFEESLKVVAAQPWIWRARGSYAQAFGRDDGARVGIAAEAILVPERGSLVLRAGPTASVAVTDNLEVVATFMPVLSSPDSLGLLGADFGQLGIRLRYATGEGEQPRR